MAFLTEVQNSTVMCIAAFVITGLVTSVGLIKQHEMHTQNRVLLFMTVNCFSLVTRLDFFFFT